MRLNFALVVAAASSAAIAVLHLAIIVVGAPAYRYFGAGEVLAKRAEEGSLFPAALTLLIAGIFTVFAAYALVGAGAQWRFPLTRTALVTIATIFILRGLSALPQAALLIRQPNALPLRYLMFSLASLIIGVFYAVGIYQSWGRLKSGQGH